MEGPLVFFKVTGGKAVAYDHIRLPRKNHIRHFAGAFCGICIIPVRHDVAFCIDITKHGTDDVSLALAVFLSDDGSCLSGNSSCIIR